MGTFIVLLVLGVLVAFIVAALVRDRKAGRCSCGHKCGSCPMAGKCHKVHN